MISIRHILYSLTLLVMVALPGGSSLQAQDAPDAGGADAEAWRAGMAEFFAGAERRAVGSEGNLEMERRVAERFAASGFEHGEIRFQAPSFKPGETYITHPELGRLALRVMHPSIFRPGNFPQTDFSAPLVYAGRGTVSDLAKLKGQNLDGSIAVLEFDCGDQWLHLMRFGVQGFIFLDQAEQNHDEARLKLANTEVAVPRFFLEGDLAERLRAAMTGGDGNATTVEVHAEPSTWENAWVRDLWVFIPGADSEGLGRQVITFVAPLDANAVVPELAASAANGANLYLLCKMLEEFQKNPPQASVMLCAVNARTQGVAGDRILAFNLLDSPDSLLKLRSQFTTRIRRYSLYLDYYRSIDLDNPEPTAAQRLEELQAVVRERIGYAASIEGDMLVIGEPLADATMSSNIVEAEHMLEVISGCDLSFLAADGSVVDEDATAIAKIRIDKVKTAEEQFIGMRNLIDDSLGVKLKVKDPLMEQARREVNLLKSERVSVVKGDLDEATKTDRLDALQVILDDRIKVLTLFNRVNPRATLSELSETQRGMVRDYLDSSREAFKDWLGLELEERELLSQNRAIYDALGGRSVPLVVDLSLDWNAPTVGFTTDRDRWDDYSNVTLGKQLSKIAADVAEAGGSDLYQDGLTNVGGLPQKHYFRNTSLPIAYYHGTAKTPAMALRNPFSSRPKAFTTRDDLASLDYDTVAKQSSYALTYFRQMLATQELPGAARSKLPTQNRAAMWTNVAVFETDDFAANALLRVGDAAIMLNREKLASDKFYPLLEDGEVIPAYIQLADARGSRVFYQLNNRVVAQAYKYDSEFRHITAMLDAGEAGMKFPSTFDPGTPRRLILFPATQEFVIASRVDPTLLSNADIKMSGIQVLDGIMNSAPRSFGLLGITSVTANNSPPEGVGPIGVVLEEPTALKLLATQKRLAINPTEDEPEGIGYRSDEELGNDLYAAAVDDMNDLNEYRLSRMVGVSNQLATDFHSRGGEALERVHDAEEANDHVGFLRSLHESLGAQQKAYSQVNGMTQDMLKAIVFYMLLMLPFCFFLQKLLFKFVKIEAQMAAFAGIFISIFVVFRLIHPAFRIARAPEAILIAFIMFALGAFVILILHARFEGEMKLLFQTFTGVNADEVGYGAVGQKAMLIGVNNMKRRRTRTALTTGTVVLVTFAMLSFSSVSKKMSPTFVPRSASAPYTGVLFHLNGTATLNSDVTRAFDEIFSDSASRIVVRSWDVPPVYGKGSTFPYAISSPAAKDVPIMGVLGLSQEEPGLLSPAGLPILPGGRYFSSDQAAEALLPVSTAAALGLDADDVGQATIRYRGVDLLLVGLLDDNRLAGLEDLNERSILPLEPVQPAGAGGGDEDGGGGESDIGVNFVQTSQLLVLPLERSIVMGAEPYSISVVLKDGFSPWEAIDTMLTVGSMKFYVASRAPFKVGPEQKATMDAGVYYVGSGYNTSMNGLSKLIIPVLIAGTIILNTMLGSVYERKYEIAVYNAIGLNPTHIFMFFLAEAAVYAVLGSVGGYLVGQVLALLITNFNLIQGLNLNFSSMMVVWVILFTVAIVVLSTLYPAKVATRAAVPSGKRKWSLPDHDGQTMALLLPFIYQPRLAPGIVEYLDDYFGRFSEASTGEMISTLIRKERVEPGGDDDRPIYNLVYDLALAPYDLGVTQEVAFNARWNTIIQSYQIEMVIARKSGQDSNWATTNKPFLERLRKHMMHWRNMSHDNQDIYVARANAEFNGDSPRSDSPSAEEAPQPTPFRDDSVPVSEDATGSTPERDQDVHEGGMSLFDEGAGPESQDNFEKTHPDESTPADDAEDDSTEPPKKP